MDDPLEQTPTTLELSNTSFQLDAPLDGPDPGHLIDANTAVAPEKPQGSTTTDRSFQIEDMLGKPIRIATFNWDTSVAANSFVSITTAHPKPTVPYQILTVNLNSMQVNLLKSFTYGHYSMSIYAQATSTMFNNGEFWIGYVPIHEVLTTRDATPNPVLLSQWTHGVINADAPVTKSFKIPWFHPQTNFNQIQNFVLNRGLGALWAYCYIPLAVPSGASTVIPINLMMTIDNPTMKCSTNPIFTWLSGTPPARAFRHYSKNVLKVLKAQLDSALAEEDEPVAQGGSVSSLWNNTVDAVTSVGSAIDKAVSLDFSGAIGDIGNAVDKGMQVADTGIELAAMFDRPANLKALVNVSQPYGPYCIGIGSDVTKRLALNPFSLFHYDSDKLSGLGGKENSIHHRCSLWTTLASFEWNSTAVEGTIIKSSLVHPRYFYSAISNGYSLTPVCFFSRSFVYWKGGFKLRFTPIKSRMHSGKLLVVFAPGFFAPTTPPTMDEVMNFPQTIIDCSNTALAPTEVRLPFNTSYEFLRCKLPTAAPANDAITAMSYLGTYYVFVYNVLQHTEAIATTIQVKLEVCVDDDFCFALPCPIEMTTARYAEPFTPMNGTGPSNAMPVKTTTTDAIEVQGSVAVTSMPSVSLTPTQIVNIQNPGGVPLQVTPMLQNSSGSASAMSGIEGKAHAILNTLITSTSPSDFYPVGGHLSGSNIASLNVVTGPTLLDVDDDFEPVAQASLDPPANLKSSFDQISDDISILAKCLAKQKTDLDSAFRMINSHPILRVADMDSALFMKTSNLFCTLQAVVVKLSKTVDASREPLQTLNAKVAECNMVLTKYVFPSDEPVAQASTELGLDSGSAPARPGHLGLEITDDIRDVVRRYTFLQFLKFDTNVPVTPSTGNYLATTYPWTQGSTGLLRITPTEITTNNYPISSLPDATYPRTLLGQMAQAYIGWAGSIRYKIHFLNDVLDNLFINVQHLPDYYLAIDGTQHVGYCLLSSGYASLPFNVVDHRCIEVEVPFASNLSFLMASAYGEDTHHPRYWTNGTLAISFTDLYKDPAVVRRNPLYAQVSIAAGDDFRFIGPRPPPPSTDTPIQGYNEVLPVLHNITQAPTTTSQLFAPVSISTTSSSRLTPTLCMTTSTTSLAPKVSSLESRMRLLEETVDGARQVNGVRGTSL
jgi:hypothetical protein